MPSARFSADLNQNGTSPNTRRAAAGDSTSSGRMSARPPCANPPLKQIHHATMVTRRRRRCRRTWPPEECRESPHGDMLATTVPPEVGQRQGADDAIRRSSTRCSSEGGEDARLRTRMTRQPSALQAEKARALVRRLNRPAPRAVGGRAVSTIHAGSLRSGTFCQAGFGQVRSGEDEGGKSTVARLVAMRSTVARQRPCRIPRRGMVGGRPQGPRAGARSWCGWAGKRDQFDGL